MLNNAPVLTGTSLSAPVNDVAQVGGAGRNVGILGGGRGGGVGGRGRWRLFVELASE